MREAKGGADQKQQGYFVEGLCVRRSLRVFGSTFILFIAGAMLTLHELEVQQAAVTAARHESGAVQVELFNHTVQHFRQVAELRARLLHALGDNNQCGCITQDVDCTKDANINASAGSHRCCSSFHKVT